MSGSDDDLDSFLHEGDLTINSDDDALVSSHTTTQRGAQASPSKPYTTSDSSDSASDADHHVITTGDDNKTTKKSKAKTKKKKKRKTSSHQRNGKRKKKEATLRRAKRAGSKPLLERQVELLQHGDDGDDVDSDSSSSSSDSLDELDMTATELLNQSIEDFEVELDHAPNRGWNDMGHGSSSLSSSSAAAGGAGKARVDDLPQVQRLTLVSVGSGIVMSIPLLLLVIYEGVLDREDLVYLVIPAMILFVWMVTLVRTAFGRAAPRPRGPPRHLSSLAWRTVVSRSLVPPLLISNILTPGWTLSMCLSAVWFVAVTKVLISPHVLHDTLVAHGRISFVLPRRAENRVSEHVTFSYVTAYLSHSVGFLAGIFFTWIFERMSVSVNSSVLGVLSAMCLFVVRYGIQVFILTRYFSKLSLTAYNLVIYSVAMGLGGNIARYWQFCGVSGAVFISAAIVGYSAMWLYAGLAIARRKYLGSSPHVMIRPFIFALVFHLLMMLTLPAVLECSRDWRMGLIFKQLPSLIVAFVSFFKLRHIAQKTIADIILAASPA